MVLFGLQAWIIGAVQPQRGVWNARLVRNGAKINKIAAIITPFKNVINIFVFNYFMNRIF